MLLSEESNLWTVHTKNSMYVKKLKHKKTYNFRGTYMHVDICTEIWRDKHIIDNNPPWGGEWEMGDGKKRFQHYLQYLSYSLTEYIHILLE